MLTPVFSVLKRMLVVSDEEEQVRIEEQWEGRGLDIPLDIVYSPYRELSRPILKFLEEKAPLTTRSGGAG